MWKLGDKPIEIIQNEEYREKRLENKNYQSLRDMLSYIKSPNIHIIGMPDGDERQNEVEKISEETLAKNLQIQDAT